MRLKFYSKAVDNQKLFTSHMSKSLKSIPNEISRREPMAPTLVPHLTDKLFLFYTKEYIYGFFDNRNLSKTTS